MGLSLLGELSSRIRICGIIPRGKTMKGMTWDGGLSLHDKALEKKRMVGGGGKQAS